MGIDSHPISNGDTDMFEAGETVVYVDSDWGECKGMTVGNSYKVEDSSSAEIGIIDGRGVYVSQRNKRFRKQTPCEKAGIKVGDKVVVTESNFVHAPIGEIMTVIDISGNLGPSASNYHADCWSCCLHGYGDTGIRVKKIFSEAEKRGAKFGTTGVVKATGKPWVLVVTDGEKWCGVDNEGKITNGMPSEFRLDHEPEYIAWSDAPEEMKWDASKVYHDGNPVKWIVKPECAKAEGVVAITDQCGIVIVAFQSELTVKL